MQSEAVEPKQVSLTGSAVLHISASEIVRIQLARARTPSASQEFSATSSPGRSVQTALSAGMLRSLRNSANVL